jgi:hypothetical protein
MAISLRTVALPLLLSALAAQDDLRDTVRLRNGKELHGRVFDPWSPREITLMQGGKRVHVARTDIADLQLIGDAVQEFLDRRLALRANDTGQWMLVEWAQTRGLANFARLQATALALRTDDERAHQYLGHRRKGEQWTWPCEGRWLSRDDLDGALGKAPMLLLGERFQLRCDCDLRANVDALFDLERAGAFLYATFGEDLQLHEALQPVRVVTSRNADAFPKWGFKPLPYFVPEPHADEGRTFFAGEPLRPRLLFFVGTHGLLYHGLIGPANPRDDRDRVCAWVELGLSMFVEQSLGGDPGFAAPVKRQVRDSTALQALDREYRLTHLLHMPAYAGFYLLDDTPTAINWAGAAMFVQFLLDPDNTPATREPFLAFVRHALAEKKGDSSSAFDASMGRRVEDFEAPFRAWLRKQAGI